MHLFVMDGHPQATVVLLSLLTQSLLTSRVFKEATMGITCSARTLSFVYLDVSIMFGTRICLVLTSRSITRGGSVAGSPKVHDRDCLIRLHTMTALLDFTRCSPSCSSYIRRTFVRLSCTYNQLTHSLQQ